MCYVSCVHLYSTENMYLTWVRPIVIHLCCYILLILNIYPFYGCLSKIIFNSIRQANEKYAYFTWHHAFFPHIIHLIPFLQKRLTIMTRYNNRNLLHDCEGKIYPLNHFFRGQRPREVWFFLGNKYSYSYTYRFLIVFQF